MLPENIYFIIVLMYRKPWFGKKGSAKKDVQNSGSLRKQRSTCPINNYCVIQIHLLLCNLQQFTPYVLHLLQLCCISQGEVNVQFITPTLQGEGIDLIGSAQEAGKQITWESNLNLDNYQNCNDESIQCLYYLLFEIIPESRKPELFIRFFK